MLLFGVREASFERLDFLRERLVLAFGVVAFGLRLLDVLLEEDLVLLARVPRHVRALVPRQQLPPTDVGLLVLVAVRRLVLLARQLARRAIQVAQNRPHVDLFFSSGNHRYTGGCKVIARIEIGRSARRGRGR